MKIVVIGGGIAGMSLGIQLHNRGADVVVCERDEEIPARGNAFLMHAEGLSILETLRTSNKLTHLPGRLIDTFNLKRPDDTEVKYLKLEPWQCIKRSDIITFLYCLFPKENIRKGHIFSHFRYDHDQAVAAVFANGEEEFGDIFIGADGAYSAVRQHLFGKTNFSPVVVKEIVGVLKHPALVQRLGSTFNKYLSKDKGLSFGFIPTSSEELVWFIQFDVNLQPKTCTGNEAMRSYCLELLKDFPAIVKDIIQQNDFTTSYIWNATDFDLLPSFHKENVVLIGDAAHLAVPFTSAGTTNALIDAKVLATWLTHTDDYRTAFTAYYQERAFLVKEHTQLGREIKEKFLYPTTETDDDIKVPLIIHPTTIKATTPKQKRVHLLYFTDPVCSTCWIIQPQLRKLKIEYGKYFEIEYCMGGLLPSWDNYSRGGISKPSDAASYWQKASEKYEMPIYPDIWVKDPLKSSYPPSIAFKAAQMQDTDKAIIFLRRINEMLFFENQNIVEKKLLKQAAYEAGLDAARLLRDIEGKAQLLFEADLELVKELEIKVLPTFIFTDTYNHSKVLKGFQEYEQFEQILIEFIPDAVKTASNGNIIDLFNKYPTLTTKEVSFLGNLDMQQTDENLQNLFAEGLLVKHAINKGDVIWRLNAAS
jgi:2-polyprenyl-6-methoxyphenol hydroxylase-like FAD-dependent oxidoreductase/predicted DsbA family dithiol-disulfide isomerase